ncbi:10503_t:CDS:2 [Cetraspora pellucida]|uniref:10503_t:CDS:1 n=1 Tax=Cetraspora pellucida TaxID=1433469 RepID=A0A9N9NKE5_9GLOM|nr:10503_t:CDS:2 [Cetraspora pellucida]
MKIKEAYDRGITPPPKHKNITPPLNNKKVILTPSSTLSSSHNKLLNSITTFFITSITNPIEIDNNEVRDNIDAELLSKTDVNISTKLYSSEISAPIAHFKKVIEKKTEDTIDVKLLLSELLDTNDNVNTKLYSSELSISIIQFKKTVGKLSDNDWPLTQVKQKENYSDIDS